jgi:MFS family permease
MRVAGISWVLWLFPIFRERSFRWFWSSNFLISLVMSMEKLAQGWLVLETTDSAFWVGAVAGLMGLGQVSFGAIGGVIADRFDRRQSLSVTLFLRGCTALSMGALVFAGHASLIPILAIAFLQGAVQGVSMPANNSLIYDLAGRERLVNAIVARMMALSLSAIPGALFAGLLISQVGVAWCYLVVAVFAYLSIFPLLAVPAGRHGPENQLQSFARNLREGIAYVLSHPRLGALLVLSVLMETFGFSFHIILPVMARDVLGVDATGLGILSAAWNVGAFASILALAALRDFKYLGVLMIGAALGAGFVIFLFALSPWFGLSVGLSMLIGGVLFAYDVTMGSLLQLLSSDSMRGRVLGLYALTFGFTPLGGFIAGAIATLANPPFALGVGGVVIIVWTARLFGPMRRIRRD